MNITRTPDIAQDLDFTVEVPITKAYVDEPTGKRHIVGVASGVAEDRDGERMSRSAIASMVTQVKKGDIKLTSRHQHDWDTEIGDAVDATHDDETDELAIDTVLPAEGADAMADKAWKVANSGRRVGFSVGGKLLSSFYERNEFGKKRKVLDSVGLRHFALTLNPSYAPSFAQAVAKTFTGDAPADDQFTLELGPDVAKDTTGSWASGSSDAGGDNVGRDSAGSGQRNAGERKPGAKRPNTEDDGDDDDSDGEKDLPKVKDERHLACPNCGHEFAADLPTNPDEQQPDEDTDNDDGGDQHKETGKTAEDSPMSRLSDTLDGLRAVVASEDVAKAGTPPAAAPVAKTATGEDGTPIEKIVAASHLQLNDKIDELADKLGPAFEAIAKSIKGLGERVADMPQGRKSVARILPLATAAGHDANGTVEKTTEELIAETDDPVEALKIANRASGWGQ